MPKVPSPILKFDSDFDFVSSNAQFMKEELEREVQEKINLTGRFCTEVTAKTQIFAIHWQMF